MIVTTIAALALMTSGQAPDIKAMPASNLIPSYGNVRSVTPALETLAQGPLADLWKRPDLNRRDRSIVTLAALIARNQTIECLSISPLLSTTE